MKLRTRTLVVVALLAGACNGALVGDDAGVDGGSTDGAPSDVAKPALDAALDGGADADAMIVDSGKDAPGDAGIVDAGGPDASACSYADAGNGNYCNSLLQSTKINVGCLSSLPAAQGGTIAPGLYYLTSADWDQSKLDGGGCYANQTRRDTIEICGDVLLWLDIDTVNSAYDGNNTFTTSGSTLTLEPYCAGGGLSMPYTATPTSLSLELDYPNNGPSLLLTFTRQ